MNVSRKWLYKLANKTNLPPATYQRMLTDSNLHTSQHEWYLFADWLLLGGGVAFILSSIVFYYAANWHHLTNWQKLGSLQILIGIGLGMMLFAHSKKWVFHTGASIVFVLIGMLWAVYGQIYNVPVHHEKTYLTWALFTLPIVVFTSWRVLWLLWWVVLNVGVWQLFALITNPTWQHPLYIIFALLTLNVAGLAILESRIQNRLEGDIWLARIVGGAILILSVVGASIAIHNDGPAWLLLTSIIAGVALCALGVWLYGGRWRNDITLWSASIFALQCIGLAFVIRLLDNNTKTLLLSVSIYTIINLMILIRLVLLQQKK